MTTSGRLSLGWIGKDQALLRTAEGGYMWVDQDDPRVTEVRLLHEVESVGEPTDNLLVIGDSRDALRSLIKIPEFADHYLGKVKQVYIDPPFNTQQAFDAYDDALEHSVWLTMMRDRLLLIRDLLAPDGSVWLHLDDAEMAYAKVLMDEIFGRRSFVATVVWQKRYSRDNRPAIGSVHDYILVYSPLGQAWKTVRNRVVRTAAKEYRNPNNDPNGPWRPIPLDVQAGHATAAQFYDVTTPSGRVVRPATGRAWAVTEPVMQSMRERGELYFGLKGDAKPNTIKYLKDDEGLVPWTWWPHEEVGHNDESKKETLALFPDEPAFDTPKPERLLQRIIQIGSDPGDLVLDCFAGSGTTAAVAHKMGRRWVTVELNSQTADRYVSKRLRRIVSGQERGGITEDVSWESGGGFRIVEVGPSVYHITNNQALLADWATGTKLEAAVAAQLGFRMNVDRPFAGSKGDSLLCVVDGVVDEEVVQAAVARLTDRQRVTIVGKGATPGASEVLRQLSPGSRLRKAPRDLIRRGVLR